MAIHKLKTDSEFFFKVLVRDKTFEVRSTKDRDFRVGDQLLLVLTDREIPMYWLSNTIGYILTDSRFVLPDHCIMSIHGGVVLNDLQVKELEKSGAILPPGQSRSKVKS